VLLGSEAVAGLRICARGGWYYKFFMFTNLILNSTRMTRISDCCGVEMFADLGEYKSLQGINIAISFLIYFLDEFI